jgi:hypothetical protein
MQIAVQFWKSRGLGDREPGLQDLLKLSDIRLAQVLDYREKCNLDNNTVMEAFRTTRQQISRLAWDAFAAALDCDSGPIAKTGVLSLPMDEATAARFLSRLQESPVAPLRRDDFAFGYMATLSESVLLYLNSTNEYREAASPQFLAIVGEFLSNIGPEIERSLGHPWRVGSIRQFLLQPGTTGGRHLDGWPVSMRKLFILPCGATRQSGTTWFRMRDGREMVLDSDKPIWAIFENSTVVHALMSSEVARPTIEVDLIPATTTSAEPFYAGNNGWYPWFPTDDGLLEGTRLALSLAVMNEGTRPQFLRRLSQPFRRLFS